MVNRKWLMVWNDSVVLCWLVGWNPKTNPVENIIEHYLNLAHLARQPGAFSIVLGIPVLKVLRYCTYSLEIN